MHLSDRRSETWNHLELIAHFGEAGPRVAGDDRIGGEQSAKRKSADIIDLVGDILYNSGSPDVSARVRPPWARKRLASMSFTSINARLIFRWLHGHR